MKTLQCYAESPWLAMVDEVVARSGAISRAALIERLLREEAVRRRVRVVPRLAASKFNKWRECPGHVRGGPGCRPAPALDAAADGEEAGG